MNPLSLTNPWVLLGLAVAFAVVAAGSFHIGGRVTAASYEADIIKAQQQKAADDAEVARKITVATAMWQEKYRALATALQFSQNTMRVVYRTIKEKVPVYVSAKADAACVVNNGFVLLFDAAFSGKLPELTPAAPAAGPVDNDRPSGVPLSKVGSVLVDNADACSQWQGKLKSCRAYVDTVTGFYNDLKASVHVCK